MSGDGNEICGDGWDGYNLCFMLIFRVKPHMVYVIIVIFEF